MRIVGPIEFWSGCVINLIFFILYFLDKSRNLSKIVSVLLSASVERFDISRMRDFFFLSLKHFCFVPWKALCMSVLQNLNIEVDQPRRMRTSTKETVFLFTHLLLLQQILQLWQIWHLLHLQLCACKQYISFFFEAVGSSQHNCFRAPSFLGILIKLIIHKINNKVQRQSWGYNYNYFRIHIL